MSSNQAKKDSIWKRILACRELYLMLLLPVIWYILFLYTPMYGIMIAFKDYRAARGIWGSEWIGLEHFKRFFSSFYFGRIVGNTLTINEPFVRLPFPDFSGLAAGGTAKRKIQESAAERCLHSAFPFGSHCSKYHAADPESQYRCL